jgi:uncharacterized SAM-binding protein YcdF (DUF218 family)
MFFIISKVLWAVFMPLTFLSLMVIGGWLARKYSFGRKVMGGAVCLLIIFGIFPMGHNVGVFWESNYPPIEKLPDHVDGVIILGGSIDFKKSLARGQGQLNMHTPRITEMMFLSKYYPDAKIVFSGGNGSLEQSSSSESIELDKVLKRINFDTSRIIYEGESRNTFENMEFSKNIVNPKEGEVWLLVTSSFHMKRSVDIFKSNGWDVIPYPAGYLTAGNYKVIPNFDVLDNMFKLQIVAKEIIGIMSYRLTGKIKTYDETDITAVSSGP